MDSFWLLMEGFGTILFNPTYLLFAFIGCFVGTLVGVLPGIGPVAGMAMLLPVSYTLDATAGIIMLASIYYGAAYGGTITSILLNVPGDANSAVTCLDGYPMAKNGRAGAALAISAIGSFVAGTLAAIGLVLIAGPVASLALKFGPAEFFSVILLSFSLVASLSGTSATRGVASAALGLLLATVGIDPVLGQPRFTFGEINLFDGFSFVAVVMGVFGVAEIFVNLDRPSSGMLMKRTDRLLPTADDLRNSTFPILRGTGLGFLIGAIPGVGGTAASFASYVVEKRLSKTPEKFGTGMIQGVAGPESANNAAGQGALVPLFTLGVPGSAAAAILMAAFIMKGLTPGPFLFVDEPQLVWAIIASLYVGNLILLLLNLPLVGMWVAILKIPYPTLMVIILGFMVLGAYSERNSAFDIGVMLSFGVLGFFMRKLDFPVAPMILAMILGPLMERSLRQALQTSGGDFSIFVLRPFSATLLLIGAVILVVSLLGIFKRNTIGGERDN